MNLSLLQASDDHRIVIENLMQFYIYDFSEFIRYDVGDNGLFAPYPDLKSYWEDENKFPYIIKMSDQYVGFVLVKFVSAKERSYFSIAEFFVLKKYRHLGIGKAIAIRVFDLHRGQWEVFQRDTNKPAHIFWNKIISEYTKGQFTERLEDGKRIQDFRNTDASLSAGKPFATPVLFNHTKPSIMSTTQPDNKQNEAKSDSVSKPDPGTTNTTDPQEHMEGPVSSLMQNASEGFEEEGAEKGDGDDQD